MYSSQRHLASLEYNSYIKKSMLIGGIRWYLVAFGGIRYLGIPNVPESRVVCQNSDVMGFAVRVRSAGQKYGPTCHQRDRADVTESVTLVRLSSLGQHVGVLALAGYKRRKSARTADPKTINTRGSRTVQ